MRSCGRKDFHSGNTGYAEKSQPSVGLLGPRSDCNGGVQIKAVVRTPEFERKVRKKGSHEGPKVVEKSKEKAPSTPVILARLGAQRVRAELQSESVVEDDSLPAFLAKGNRRLGEPSGDANENRCEGRHGN